MLLWDCHRTWHKEWGQVNKVGKERGRRMLLGVRVPQLIDECLDLGYDVPAWIQNGLVDYVAPTDFFFSDFNAPYEEFTKLVRKTDCMLYPCIQPNLCWEEKRGEMAIAEYRAVVRNFYAAGADGFSVHNYMYHWWPKRPPKPYGEYYYPSPSDMTLKNYADLDTFLGYFADLRDPESLAAGERRYVYLPLWAGHNNGKAPTGRLHCDRTVIKRDRPLERASYRFRICEHLDAGDVKATLLFRATGLLPQDKVRIDIGGKEVPPQVVSREYIADGRTDKDRHQLPPYSQLSFDLSGLNVTCGDNELGVTLVDSASGGADDIVIQEVEVTVV